MAATSPSFHSALQPHIHIAGEVCPWCEQPVPHDKFEEVSRKIEAKEKQRTDEIERSLRDQHARDRQVIEAKAKAEIEAASKASAEILAKVRADAAAEMEQQRAQAAARDLQRSQEFDARLAVVQQETKAATERAAAAALEKANIEKLAALEARDRATTELAKMPAKIEEALATRTVSLREKLAAAEAEKLAAKEARAEAERNASALKVKYEQEIIDRTAEVREALTVERDAAVLQAQKKAFDDHQKLQSTVQDLQRQLERKTADELGEGAEIDLFEALKGAFEDDRIRRVKKGVQGADIVHEVVVNGQVCGKIVYDSKNRDAWQNTFATKLWEDTVAEKADHGVLSTNRFPAGTRQLHLHEGVIIACPARVLAIAELLRNHIVTAHTLRMSNQQKEEKTALLYSFMTSERCSQLLESIETLIAKMEELDVAEQKAHEAVWKKRGTMIRSMLKNHGDFVFEIDRIVGTAENAE